MIPALLTAQRIEVAAADADVVSVVVEPSCNGVTQTPIRSADHDRSTGRVEHDATASDATRRGNWWRLGGE
jgi:hypothetical protein